MKKLMIPILLLLALTACQSKEEQQQHDAMVAQQARAQLLAELKAKEEAKREAEAQAHAKASKLSKVGIEIEGSKIIIDTNKTKGFFKSIAHRLEAKMQKLQQDLQKGKLVEDSAGVEIDEQRIHIDLNKTQSFLESWGSKMQSFVKDIDALSEKIASDKKGL